MKRNYNLSKCFGNVLKTNVLAIVAMLFSATTLSAQQGTDDANGDANDSIKNFNNIIRFSSILTKDQVKLLFMGDLAEIPLIYDGKYLSDDERIDLLIEYKRRLKKVDSNLYLFFNHVENYLD